MRLLVENQADVDSQDNRKVSCLMASFRKVRTVMHMFLNNKELVAQIRRFKVFDVIYLR